MIIIIVVTWIMFKINPIPMQHTHLGFCRANQTGVYKILSGEVGWTKSCIIPKISSLVIHAWHMTQIISCFSVTVFRWVLVGKLLLWYQQSFWLPVVSIFLHCKGYLYVYLIGNVSGFLKIASWLSWLLCYIVLLSVYITLSHSAKYCIYIRVHQEVQWPYVDY